MDYRGKHKRVGILGLDSNLNMTITQTIVHFLDLYKVEPVVVPYGYDRPDLQPDSVGENLDLSTVDGVIFLSAIGIRSDYLKECRDAGIPVVCGQYCIEADYDTVSMDHAAAMRLILTHLINRGHSRIAFVSLDIVLDPSFAIRAELYQRMMGKQGLDAQYIPIPASAPLTEEDVKVLLEPIIRSESRPDAVMFCTDAHALKIVPMLTDAGMKIPEDVSIACLGRHFLPEAWERFGIGGITGIDFPSDEIGFHCVKRLLARLEDPDIPSSYQALLPKPAETDSVVKRG